MTLTVRQSSVTGATTAGRALTHAEMDANWAHVIDSSNSQFTPSGTGAVSRTVAGRLQETISVLDFIPVPLHAAIANGTNTTDLATYIVSAVAAAAGRTLLFPAGYYYIDATRIEVTDDQIWRGEGPGLTHIQWANEPSGTAVCLEVYGPALTEIPVAPNSVAIGDPTITFASDPGSLSGLLVLQDSASSSFSGFRASYTAGEIVEVASQVTSTITLKSRALGVYTASATFKAYTYSPITFQLYGIKFTFPLVNEGFRMRRVQNWRIDNCKFVGGDLVTVDVADYCYRGIAIGSEAEMSNTAASDQYAWACSGIQDAKFIGCTGTATRHGFQTGGDNIMPNRRIVVEGGQYFLTSEAQGQCAVDCHGNSEYVEFTGIQCEGALIAGNHIKFTNNQIVGRGFGIGIREMLGSDFDVSNNDIKTFFANPSSTRASGITMQSGATSASTAKGGHLRIRNNTIEYAGSTARPGIVLVYESGFALGSTTDVTVEWNEVRLTTALATAVVVQGLSTSAGTLRSIKCRANRVSSGGFDLRYATTTWLDDNDQNGGTDVGALIRNSSTAATDQTFYVRRNKFATNALAGVSIVGDSTNKFLQGKIQDNDFSGNSATNQGSSSNEASIVATNTTTLLLERNTTPVAGANQTFDYSIDVTVDTLIAKGNRGVVGDYLLSSPNLIQDGNQWNESGKYVIYRDDFLGDVLADEWGTAVGSNGSCVAAAITQALNGRVRLVTGADAGGTMALNGSQLHQQLNWRAQSDGMSMEFNIAINNVTNVAVFVGLTDQIAALEIPIESAASGDTLTSNASNAVGVLFDTAMSTDNWWLVGVKADTDATAQDAGVAPANNTIERWKIRLTTGGNAYFYRNGSLVGSVMSNAVTASTVLTPVVAALSRSSSSRNIELDFIELQMQRE